VIGGLGPEFGAFVGGAAAVLVDVNPGRGLKVRDCLVGSVKSQASRALAALRAPAARDRRSSSLPAA